MQTIKLAVWFVFKQQILLLLTATGDYLVIKKTAIFKTGVQEIHLEKVVCPHSGASSVLQSGFLNIFPKPVYLYSTPA